MIARCYRLSHPAYGYYGGRGIKVCERWRKSYKDFLSDMGEAPDGMWIDRIDFNRDYEPGNVRWVTPKQSAQNRRKRSQVTGSIRQRARELGMPYPQVIQRIHRGWSVEQALSIPMQKRGAMKHYDKIRFGLMGGELDGVAVCPKCQG